MPMLESSRSSITRSRDEMIVLVVMVVIVNYVDVY